MLYLKITLSDTNICHFLDLATTLPPLEIDQIVCLKTAVLITAIFSKNLPEHCEESTKHHYEYVCLKLGLYLLSLANSQNDNRGEKDITKEISLIKGSFFK